MKLAAIVIVGLVAVILGAMAGAWRRACVHMARTVFGVRMVSRLSPADRDRFTPPFVGSRQKVAIVLFLLTAVLAAVFFGWLVGIGAFFAVWLLSELVAFAFPGPSHPYYAQQAVTDLAEREAMYSGFGEKEIAADLGERRTQLSAAYNLSSDQL